MTSIKKKYGRAAGSGEVPSAFATMAKADKIGTEKFTAKKTYGGDVGLGLNSDALEMHRKKLAEKNGTGKLASSIHSRGSSHSKRGGGRPKLDILSLVDGAIEDGATCEAKEKAAAEKAAADAPILPKKKVKVIKPKKTEEAKPPLAPPSKKAQEVTEKAIETKEPEKPTIDPPKPKSAKFLSSVDKAIESDAPAPGVPSLFGSSTSKTTTSTDGVPAWKAKLKAQKASGEVQSSTPQRQASARTPINIAKKADTIPKKSKSTPLVISKPKSPAKVSPAKQASSVEIVAGLSCQSPFSKAFTCSCRISGDQEITIAIAQTQGITAHLSNVTSQGSIIPSSTRKRETTGRETIGEGEQDSLRSRYNSQAQGV
jgi:hypothetical protein